jgi:dienelactone hydrolase
MAEVLLFHHIQGLTEGVVAFADELRASGHTVHTPDLFDGRTFDTIEEGFTYAQGLGDAPDAAANGEADALPEALVYAGFSWGVGPAQRLAQTRAGARGALLYEACYPITGEYAFGPWPDGVPVQIHGKEDDQFFAHEGDIDAARELVATVGAGAGRAVRLPRWRAPLRRPLAADLRRRRCRAGNATDRAVPLRAVTGCASSRRHP